MVGIADLSAKDTDAPRDAGTANAGARGAAADNSGAPRNVGTAGTGAGGARGAQPSTNDDSKVSSAVPKMICRLIRLRRH